MTNFYVSSTANAAVAQWAAAHAYSLGDFVRNLATPTQGLERVFKCTTAGTSGGAEPTWNRNNNATTTDNTVTWTQVAGQEAQQVSGNWKAPFASVFAWANLNFSQASDVIFVSSDHDEIITSNPGFQLAGRIVSVSKAGSVPPVAADYAAGAILETSGANSLSFAIDGYASGLTFSAGSAANNASCLIQSRGFYSTYENCTYKLNTTNSSAAIGIGRAESFQGQIVNINPAFLFGATTQSLSFGDDYYLMYPGPATIFSGTMPSSLFADGQTGRGYVRWHGMDFTTFTGANMWASGSIKFVRGGMDFIDCKLPSTEPNIRNTQDLGPGEAITFWNCDNGDNKSYRFYTKRKEGVAQSSDGAARVGGANDGVASYGLKLMCDVQSGNPTLSATYFRPLRVGPIVDHLAASGSAVTSTIEFCSSEALNNLNAWLELETLESSSNSKGTHETTRTANILTASSALTTSSADWTATATARQNSHAYVLGDIYKAASNAGRLFICNFAGTTASSEPGGIASSTDGTTTTDGSAHFIAAYRYKLAITFTPQRKGDIRGYFCANFPSANTYIFVDPYLVTA